METKILKIKFMSLNNKMKNIKIRELNRKLNYNSNIWKETLLLININRIKLMQKVKYKLINNL